MYEYEDIKIKLNPYLGCSDNLMEFFVVIGYEEAVLKEIIYNHINGESVDNFKVSIVSSDISDLALKIFNPDYIINQVYPANPLIVRQDTIPKSSNVIFSSCFDSIDAKNKIFYSCYALRFYEKYIDIDENEYYVPKAFLILSQYPYFTTYKKICEMALDYVKSDVENKIPIEILIHCWINYIPSPINDSLRLNNFSPTIFIPRLTGYPYIDFDLCKIFNIIPINEFIQIYIMIFLEVDLLFFSSDLEKLNFFLYILLIINYPLTDSIYYWNIKSISENSLKDDGIFPIWTCFMGVNTKFDSNLISSFSDKFKKFNFIIDMENKKDIINPLISGKDSKEIHQLYLYIDNIINNKKIDKSFFLKEYLLIVKSKLKEIFEKYTSLMKGKTIDTFFNINEQINKINRRIQEIFYDFVLNILVVLYKDFEINNKLETPIKKRKYINPKLSEEEKIFLKYYRRTSKYNTYFESFLTYFDVPDEIKVSLLFSDEYVNLKMKDINKNIPTHIKYFDIMDKIYSSKPKIKDIDFKDLFEEYKKVNGIKSSQDTPYITPGYSRAKSTIITPSYSRTKSTIITPNYPRKKSANITPDNSRTKSVIITSCNTNKENEQLFSLNKNLIRLFIFQKKNRDFYKILKKEKEINADIIDKVSIPFTLLNNFHSVLNPEYYIRSSLIYIFSIIFPLLSFLDSQYFLVHILRNLKLIKYFQRYYIYIIIKSIYLYYILNQKLGQFPQYIANNAVFYCEMITTHLMDNLIYPNEEIFEIFKKIYTLREEEDKTKHKGPTPEGTYKDYLYIFHNKEKDFIKNINNKIVIREGDFLVYYYQGITKKCHLIKQETEIFQRIFSIHDNFFNYNFTLENLNFKELIEVIINAIYFLNKYKETEIANLLTNVVILLKIVGNNIYDYKEKKKNNNI